MPGWGVCTGLGRSGPGSSMGAGQGAGHSPPSPCRGRSRWAARGSHSRAAPAPVYPSCNITDCKKAVGLCVKEQTYRILSLQKADNLAIKKNLQPHLSNHQVLLESGPSDSKKFY